MNIFQLESILKEKNWTNQVSAHPNHDVVILEAEDIPPGGFDEIQSGGWGFDYSNFRTPKEKWFHLKPENDG